MFFVFEVCGIDVNMQDVYVPYMNQHHEINDVVLEYISVFNTFCDHTRLQARYSN